MKKTGVELIAAERRRQVEEEGWTAEHDQHHHQAELARAAVAYASPPGVRVWLYEPTTGRQIKPWPWSTTNDPQQRSVILVEQRIRDLVKAGALIAAEIDRLGRE